MPLSMSLSLAGSCPCPNLPWRSRPQSPSFLLEVWPDQALPTSVCLKGWQAQVAPTPCPSASLLKLSG